MPITINDNNRTVYIIIIIILGASSVSAVVGDIFLSYMDKHVPESLIMLGSASTGALVSLFSVSHKE